MTEDIEIKGVLETLDVLAGDVQDGHNYYLQTT